VLHIPTQFNIPTQPRKLEIKLDMASVCSETARKHPKTLPQSIQVDMMDTDQVTKMQLGGSKLV
jgi:hypothetical protein